MKRITNQLLVKNRISLKPEAIIEKNPDKLALVEYLSSGELYGEMASGLYDSVTDTDYKETISVYSDGEYSWNDADIYYFSKYDIALEKDFVDKVLNMV